MSKPSASSGVGRGARERAGLISLVEGEGVAEGSTDSWDTSVLA